MTLIVLFVFVALSGFVDFVGQINDIGIGDYGVNQAIQYTLLKLPSSIFQLMPIAVFDRPKYKNISLSSRSSKKFRKFRYLEKLSKRLPFLKPPAWIYFHGKQNYAKSSLIRKKNEN